MVVYFLDQNNVIRNFIKIENLNKKYKFSIKDKAKFKLRAKKMVKLILLSLSNKEDIRYY